MNADFVSRFEQLLERELSVQDKTRLLRIKDVLNIGDNDAFWDILIAMEYQRIYYEELPQRIEQSATSILEKLSHTAKQEVAAAQASLAERVVKQAKKLSTKEHIQTWLFWGSIALTLGVIYGSLMLWVGYGLGMGKLQELHMLLRLPIGFVLGGGAFCGGIWLGLYTAKAFAEDNTIWKKYMWIAVGCIALGGLLLAASL